MSSPADEAELEAFTETGHHVTGASGHEIHHGLRDSQYALIFVALVVVTALEISLTYMDIGAWFLPLMITLMTIKFFSVVLFFMHLRFDNKLFSALFYMGLGLAVFVYTVAMFTFHVFEL
jgi:cytochrome c oxidase subunit IV